MSEENKSLAQRWNRIFEGDFAVAHEIISDECVYHDGPPGLLPGPDGATEWAIMFRNGFPDARITEEEIVADEDLAAVRFVAEGAHGGEFMGVPATGNRVTVSGVCFMRIAQGKIMEHWGGYDALGLMRQIGAGPST